MKESGVDGHRVANSYSQRRSQTGKFPGRWWGIRHAASSTSRLRYVGRLPERGSQAHSGEYLRRLRNRPSTEGGRHAIAIPCLGECPRPRQGQRFSTQRARCRAPPIHILLRPEERDHRSGVDEVVVPLPEQQGEMHYTTSGVELTGRDRVRCRITRRCEDGLDLRVRVEHRGDAEGVPRAISP